MQRQQILILNVGFWGRESGERLTNMAYSPSSQHPSSLAFQFCWICVFIYVCVCECMHTWVCVCACMHTGFIAVNMPRYLFPLLIPVAVSVCHKHTRHRTIHLCIALGPKHEQEVGVQFLILSNICKKWTCPMVETVEHTREAVRVIARYCYGEEYRNHLGGGQSGSCSWAHWRRMTECTNF